MKVAMVTEYIAPKDGPYFGGVDARTINIAKNMVKGDDVHIITAYLEGTDRIEDYDGVTVHRVGRKRRFTQKGDFLPRLMFSAEVVAEISRMKPDIVDGGGAVAYAACYKGALRNDIPSVVTVMEVWQGQWLRNMGLMNGLAGNILERIHLKYNFDRYVAISKYTREKLNERLQISDDKISLVYCGYDRSLYESVAADEKFADPTIVIVCRLVSYKNVDDLLCAVKLLLPSFPDLKLKIIGTGPEEKNLRKLARRLSLGDHVEFLGKIKDNDRLIGILKRSHVFAIPSVAEGFGIVLIEAMAAGIPYVASDIPAYREVTEGGIGGFLHKPDDYRDLAGKLKILLEDEKLRRDIVRDNDRLLKKYEWPRLAREVRSIYEELLNKN